MAHRGPFAGKCIGASIKGEHLEDVVWSDVSRFLVDPSTNSSDELLADDSMTPRTTPSQKPNATPCIANRSRMPQQLRRTRAIDLYTRGKLSEIEFDAIAADVERELKTLDERLACPRTRLMTLLDDGRLRACARGDPSTPHGGPLRL